jgi:hypothetical protein
MASSSWARYLRKVHIEWCPWKPKANSPAWLGVVGTRRVAEASPKLVITKDLLAKSADLEAPLVDRTTLTYADGTEQQLDLNIVSVRDVLEEIEMANGRLSAEEATRGRPFP